MSISSLLDQNVMKLIFQYHHKNNLLKLHKELKESFVYSFQDSVCNNSLFSNYKKITKCPGCKKWFSLFANANWKKCIDCEFDDILAQENPEISQ